MDRLASLISSLSNTSAAGAHPAADMLTAFAEGSLSRAEREQVITHLGICRDCRQVVYLASTEVAEAGREMAGAPRRGFQSALRWGVALSSAAMLVAVFALRYSQKQAPAAPSRVAVMESPHEFDQLTPSDKIPPVASLERKDGAQPRPSMKHMTARPKANLEFDESGQVRIATPAAPPAPAMRSNNTRAKTAAPERDETAPATQANEQKQPNEPKQGNEQKKELAAATTTAVAAVPLADAGRVVAPPQWRLSRGNMERSLDEGRTWQPVLVGSGVPVDAFAVVGTTIWAAGKGGAVYQSEDSGSTWIRFHPTVAGKFLTTDVSRIQFSSSLKGSLTTVNGEVWSTADGGQTWSRK
jgi:hypothetical protein